MVAKKGKLNIYPAADELVCALDVRPLFRSGGERRRERAFEIPRMVAYDWVNKNGQTYRICNGLLISSVLTLGPAKRVKSIPSDSGKLGGSAYNDCYVWRGVIEGRRRNCNTTT